MNRYGSKLLIVAFVLSAGLISHRPAYGEEGAGSLKEQAIASGNRYVLFTTRAPGKDGHWYGNFGHTSTNPNSFLYGGKGGTLALLDLATGNQRLLLEDKTGDIRDPQVHYSGKRAIFSWRKGGSNFFNLHEIDLASGATHPLTSGEQDDLEPTYLPDGGIMFVSSRCNRWVPCYHTQVATLYRCEADGSNLRMISTNVEQDNTPWPLPDGRIMYTRWEYVDRFSNVFHGLWTINADGSGVMTLLGNMYPDGLYIDAKPIPGTGEIVYIYSPGHGQKEHQGRIAIFDPKRGPDQNRLKDIRAITKSDCYRDPYAIGADLFLAARNDSLVLLNRSGREEEILQLGGKEIWVHEPRPVREHAIEPQQPARIGYKGSTGSMLLSDIYRGRNMQGVARGSIKQLLLLEVLPRPVSFTGTSNPDHIGPSGTHMQEPISLGGTYFIERVLGTVPVEEDGSAWFEVPANRPLFFVALDQQGLAVKRMQSFVNIVPGETAGCVGCHENRTETMLPGVAIKAMQRPRSQIQPVAGVPETLDFPRDIQPILDRHCVSCHNPEKRAGSVLLTGHYNEWFSQSYFALFAADQITDGRNAPEGNQPPYSIGTSASKLMEKIGGSHHNVTLTPNEHLLVATWIEAGANYAGTYGALASGMVRVDRDRIWQLCQESCGKCHSQPREPQKVYDGAQKDLMLGTRFPKRDRFHGWLSTPFRYRLNLFDLSRPEQSTILQVPLARSAGGWAEGKEADRSGAILGRHPALFASTQDPVYQGVLVEIQKAAEKLNRIKRFDMPDFRPNQHYIREMQRYGILSANIGPADPVNSYEIDRRYWQSFWSRPAGP